MSKERNLVQRGEKDRLQNLTDVSDLKELDKTRDLDFASQDIISWLCGTDRLLKLTDYSPIIAEENFRFLKEQLALALKREEEQGQKKEQFQQNRVKQRKIIKEQIARFGLPLLAIGSIIGLGDLVYQNVYSPEARAQRQTREIADKIKFEQENILGLKPTLVTSSDWRVRCPAAAPNIDYIEGNGKDDKLKVFRGAYIYFDSSHPGTGISIDDYKKSDGELAVKLHVITKVNYPNQDRILRNEPTEEIDNRVVVFERLNDFGEVAETKYVAISRMESDPRYFILRVMQRVKR